MQAQTILHFWFTELSPKHHCQRHRFGRYPHRNDILGRQSTPEELVF
nr:DUF924 family protein [uncultured Limnohabitans sp.]